MEKIKRVKMRREISACFLPTIYFTRGFTKKDLFKRELLRTLGKTYRKEA